MTGANGVQKTITAFADACTQNCRHLRQALTTELPAWQTLAEHVKFASAVCNEVSSISSSLQVRGTAVSEQSCTPYALAERSHNTRGRSSNLEASQPSVCTH